MQKYAILVKKRLKIKMLEDEKWRKVRDYCHYTGKYRGATHSICNLKYSKPKDIITNFHNGFNFDKHFIIKQLAEDSEGQFNFWEKILKNA